MVYSGSKKNPLTAAALSLIPGLGQLYVGRNRKAVALLCVVAGLILSFFLVHSRLAAFLVGMIYLLTMVPAGIEAYLIAKTGHSSPMLNSKPYIVLMLLTTGINALPLLWQNELFSRRAKILWTIAVPLLAALFFGGLWMWGASLKSSL